MCLVKMGEVNDIFPVEAFRSSVQLVQGMSKESGGAEITLWYLLGNERRGCAPDLASKVAESL